MKLVKVPVWEPGRPYKYIDAHKVIEVWVDCDGNLGDKREWDTDNCPKGEDVCRVTNCRPGCPTKILRPAGFYPEAIRTAVQLTGKKEPVLVNLDIDTTVALLSGKDVSSVPSWRQTSFTMPADYAMPAQEA